jgi:DNA-binding MarR family transcriptional regulator
MQKLSNILAETSVHKKLKARAKGFTQIPNWFLMDQNYTIYDKMTYILIKKYKMKKDHCWPSIKTLAERIGCSESSVKKSIKRLIASEAIRKGKNKKIRSNIYYPKI